MKIEQGIHIVKAEMNALLKLPKTTVSYFKCSLQLQVREDIEIIFTSNSNLVHDVHK